jgi:acyl-CoA synthetase (AMP-forming)/AMP-acid ligase II
VIELLRRAAGSDPGSAAIVSDERTWTYGELLERSEALAAAFGRAGVERFGSVTPDAADVVTLLAAASLAGVEACQYPPTSDDAAARDLAGRLDHTVVVTDPALLTDLSGRTTIDQLLAAAEGGPRVDAPPAARPLLVLTTGTTGVPRAARHDWARLLRATERIQPAPDQRWLLAYGLHQFAGLQILLHVLSAGATLVVPASARPLDGLAAIRRHEVRFASATPTWWRFLLAELRGLGDEAPAMQQITLGGEASPESLLEQLAETFPSARIAHVYAATEVGSTGSVGDGREGLHVSVLDRGEDADVGLRVVDGELWVRSRVGMLGYYGEPDVDADGWRATGDLVEVVGDRILFRGRTSEVINVGGVKVHPLPIEELVERVPGVDVARVFGRPNKMTGMIVAVEAVAAPGTDREALIDAIRDACAELPAASRPRSVKVVDEIATHGGKRTRRSTDV